MAAKVGDVVFKAGEVSLNFLPFSFLKDVIHYEA
jgi:hypothetical protein